ncbi:MAG: hypothetical protein ABSC20_07390 [Candidatus Bathyarchaeia archaeon]
MNSTNKRGVELLRDPSLNKSTRFTEVLVKPTWWIHPSARLQAGVQAGIPYEQ